MSMTPLQLSKMLMTSALVGVPVLSGAQRGNKYMEGKYEPLDVRLRKVSVGDTSMKTGSEKQDRFGKFREKTAVKGWSDLILRGAKGVGGAGAAGGAAAGAAGAAGAGALGAAETSGLFAKLLGAEAIGSSLGGLSSILSPTADVAGYRLYQKAYGPMGMIDTARIPENALTEAGKSFGKDIGSNVASGVTNLISNVMTANKNILVDSHKRTAILNQLRMEDPLIKKIPMKQALEAYHTMVTSAPMLSTDKNAVKSYLRTVAMAPEGGVDWNTIKGLADTESSLRKAKGLDQK